MNGGRCVYNNTCQCPPHWTGEHCEQSLSSTTYANTHTDMIFPRSTSTCNMTCMNGGTCSGINSCACITEYDGLQCEHKKVLLISVHSYNIMYPFRGISTTIHHHFYPLFLLFLIILIIAVVFSQFHNLP